MEWGRTDGEDVYFAEFDDPGTNHGIAQDLDWDDVARFTATGAFRGFALTARYSTREKGVPTAAWSTAFNDERSVTKGDWGGIDLGYHRQLTTAIDLNVRSNYDLYRFRGAYPYVDEMLDNTTDAHALGAEAQLNWDISPGYRLTVGSELMRQLRGDYRNWTDGELTFDQDHPYTLRSAYVQLDARFTRGLGIVAGVRHDDYSYTSTGTTTPRLGLLAAPDDDTSLKLLWGRAFRAPNVYEQFVINGAANELDPEQVNTWELTVERRLGRQLLAFGSIYRYSVEGLIEQEGSTDVFMYGNFGHVHATGAEIGAVLRNSWLTSNVSYSHNVTEDQHTHRRLTNSPSHLLKAAATLLLPHGVQATWTQRYESERLTLLREETEPFTVADVTLRHAHEIGLSVTLKARNLFDTKYATPGGLEHAQQTLQQDGRTLALRVEWSF
jgi:iron complex outermembrane receptor protein